MMADLCIIYSCADRLWAEWLASQARGVGYAVVLRAWDARPGASTLPALERAVVAAERVVAVLSPDYPGSACTPSAWAAALKPDATGDQDMLLMVRVRECALEDTWTGRPGIDLVGLDEAAARHAFLAGLCARWPVALPTVAGSDPEVPPFPGALPPVWNVPRGRNPVFTGREDLLGQLEDTLRSRQCVALMQAPGTPGGVGMTTVAIEYAFRHATAYDVVWWVQAEDPVALAHQYAALAAALGLPEGEMPLQAEAVAAVRRWLEGRGRWLLILDDAPSPEAMQDYLPRGAVGQVLITTSDAAWRDMVDTLNVVPWSRSEAAGYLLRRTGLEDRQTAAALAEVMGGLPLVLEQAAAYVVATGCSLHEYLTLFHAHREALARADVRPTTWALGLARAAETPGAAELLYLCAFLAAADIPCALLQEGAEHMPASLGQILAEPGACEQAMMALQRYALVEMRGGVLRVPRGVAVVTRDHLVEGERLRWATAAVVLVDGALSSAGHDDADTWSIWACLLPHALAATRHAECLEVVDKATGHLLNQVGLYLWERGQLAWARRCFERALALDETLYGSDHPVVAVRTHNLGLALRDIGDLAGARTCFERALRIDEVAYGLDHAEVATDASNLGVLLWAERDLQGARQCFERALRIDNAIYGSEHIQLVRDINNLAGVLRDQGELLGARGLYAWAQMIDERTHGPNHPTVARDLRNLGAILKDLGDLEGAQEHFRRASRIDDGTP